MEIAKYQQKQFFSTGKGVFSAFQLKMILCVLMLIDHVVVIFPFTNQYLRAIIHIGTRIVCPSFSFLCVESYKKTSNKSKYCLRLFFWAGITTIGNVILMYLYNDRKISIQNNIIATFAVSILILICIEKKRALNTNNSFLITKYFLYFLSSVLSVFTILFFEGGFLVLPFILITFFVNETKLKIILYSILSLGLLGLAFLRVNQLVFTDFAFHSEFLFPMCFPFLRLYKGTRGASSLLCKYFFYSFYPIHLWVLYSLLFLFW